jgi:hypothetical protein
MPAQRESSVTRDRRSRASTTSGRAGSGTTTVIAESPFQPSISAPLSTETMSPGCSTRSPGMPCTTSSLTDTHTVWRYPGTSWKLECPPSARIAASAAASSSPVVTPGAMSSRTASSDAAVARPGATMRRISSGVL